MNYQENAVNNPGNEVDFSAVPPSFVYCLASDCIRAGECLRRLAVEHIAEKRRTMTALNPLRTRTDGSCPEFLTCSPSMVAYGWGKLYDKMPHRTAVAIKEELLKHFGKTEYYRKGRLEKPLTPDEQAYVRSLFQSHGLTEEPEYERCEEQVLW